MKKRSGLRSLSLLLGVIFSLVGGERVYAKARVIKVLPNPTRVILTSISRKKPWAVNDAFCIYSNNKEKIACGSVAKIKGNKALGAISLEQGVIEKGQTAKRKKRKPKRLASQPLIAVSERGPNLLMRNNLVQVEQTQGSQLMLQSFNENALTGGASLGFNHLIPSIHYQRALLYHFALGLEAIYLNASANDDSFTAMGGFITANYYSFQPFRGLWMQAKLGPMFSTAKSLGNEENATILLMGANIGWREHWIFGSNIAICAGFQYVTDPNFNFLTLQYKGIQLAVGAEIGFTF